MSIPPTSPTGNGTRPNKFGFGRFGTLAGVLSGVAAGVGMTVLLSQRAPPASVAAVAAVAASRLPSAAGSTASLSMADAVARQMQVRREAIARHEREPRDPQWSAATEKLISDLLATLAGPGKFRVSSVDCRTTSCVALLRVATFADAQSAWPSIVQARNDAGCSTAITLTEAQPGATPYDFDAIYDCTQARHTK